MYLRERVWDEQQLSPAERTKARAEPEGLGRTMTSLKRLALRARQRVLPKSTLGKACDYLLSQWAPLSAHLHHGESRLDNNLVENAIRPSCIGKKNWLPDGLYEGHPHASAADDKSRRPLRPYATGVETGSVVVPISLVSIATIVVVTIEISHW